MIFSQILDQVSLDHSEVQCSIALAHPDNNRDNNYLPCMFDRSSVCAKTTIPHLISISFQLIIGGSLSEMNIPTTFMLSSLM